MLSYERDVLQQGFGLPAGIDEAGRGPLAGPVVAAAVILPLQWDEQLLSRTFAGVNDSKKLTPRQRCRAYELIREKAVAIGVGIVDEKTIDEINILQATFRAMRRAVEKLRPCPDYLLIDGQRVPGLDIPQRAIRKGDSLSLSIAAASIVAKVTRDRQMEEYHLLYPQYNFAAHKGYGTREHLAAIAKHGPCPIHRRSFRRVGSG